jgi:hypothetical protein
MPSSGSCGASTRGVIFNFGYLGTNKKQSADPDPSCHKYPIPDDTPLPFGHRKIMPRAATELLTSGTYDSVADGIAYNTMNDAVTAAPGLPG